ncbi:MAG: hypothetical protein KGI58_01445 [Patescibacteria group bacterium]|nr:hypothetical protein [Patescibacteria group bacterium]
MPMTFSLLGKEMSSIIEKLDNQKHLNVRTEFLSICLKSTINAPEVFKFHLQCKKRFFYEKLDLENQIFEERKNSTKVKHLIGEINFLISYFSQRIKYANLWEEYALCISEKLINLHEGRKLPEPHHNKKLCPNDVGNLFDEINTELENETLQYQEIPIFLIDLPPLNGMPEFHSNDLIPPNRNFNHKAKLKKSANKVQMVSPELHYYLQQ